MEKSQKQKMFFPDFYIISLPCNKMKFEHFQHQNSFLDKECKKL